MNTIYFSGKINPMTGEQYIQLVERSFEPNPAPMRIDVRYSDPTLTIFHEVHDATSQGAEQKEDSSQYQNRDSSGQAAETGGCNSPLTSQEDE